MRLTTRTDIAIRALMYCAANPRRIVKKSAIASACNTSENHMAQVINTLSHEGLFKTVRGRGGGVMLGKPANEISIGTVFRMLESGIPFVECFSQTENNCPISDYCKLRGALCGALDAFYAALDQISLEGLVRGNGPLQEVLSQP